MPGDRRRLLRLDPLSGGGGGGGRGTLTFEIRSTEEDEEEDTCEDVEAAAAELLERAMQRFERLRIFLTDATGATTAGSGSATGMAARCARARWLGPRAMCGLAVAERATVRTTRTLAKNMVACRS